MYAFSCSFSSLVLFMDSYFKAKKITYSLNCLFLIKYSFKLIFSKFARAASEYRAYKTALSVSHMCKDTKFIMKNQEVSFKTVRGTLLHQKKLLEHFCRHCILNRSVKKLQIRDQLFSKAN